jgi:gliding motility-associated-like protein
MTAFDVSARPDQLGYVYYLEAIDDCGQVVQYSNKFRTVFLSGQSDKYTMENDIKWTSSIYVDSSALEKDVYHLYRAINRSYTDVPIRSKWVNELYYLDDISSEIHNGDEFCYTMKLVQAPSDTFVLSDTTISNEICFKMEPDIFIPNSFSPNDDGKNETWRPKTKYIVPFQNYNLKVFDRWGNMIFETTDPLEGWNGTRNDGNAAAGSYVYKLEVTTVYGSKINRNGQVILIR